MAKGRLTTWLRDKVARGLITAVGAEVLARSLRDEVLARSLRDMATSGSTITTPQGRVAVVRTDGSDPTTKLFKKQNVRMLRNYAEYSIWVRAALDIYRQIISQAQWTLTPFDPAKPMNQTVEKKVRSLLDSPNEAKDPYSTLQEKFVEDHLVLGHGANELLLRRNTELMGILTRDAATIGFVKGWDGTDPAAPRYALLNASGQPAQYFHDRQLMVLVNRARSYDDLGLSHVEVLDTTVRALLNGDEYFLRQVTSPSPNGALNLGTGVSQQQVDEVRSQIETIKHKFMVMGGTTDPKFIPFAANEDEMKLLDTQVFFVRQVAAVFQLPTASLALAVDTSRANTEAMLKNSDSGPGALLWRMRELENKRVVAGFGPVEKHNILLDYPIMSKRDERQQAEVTRTSVGGRGWITINEARKQNGQEPIDDMEIADEVLVSVSGGVVPLKVLNDQFFVNPQPQPTTPPNGSTQQPPADGPDGEDPDDEDGKEPETAPNKNRPAKTKKAADSEGETPNDTEVGDARAAWRRVAPDEAASLFDAEPTTT